jgi:hypothetical protein
LEKCLTEAKCKVVKEEQSVATKRLRHVTQ